MTQQSKSRLFGYLTLATMLLFLLGGTLYLQGAGVDTANPRANFWRVVRHGIPGYTSVASQGHDVLIQNTGENWREIRDILIVKYTPWLLGLTLVAMLIFYSIVGTDKLKKPRSGVKIARFNLAERLLHWCTALLFIIMAVTGLSLLLGRTVLIPVFGHAAVSSYLSGSKLLHNYCGPLFLIGIFLEFVIWVRYNIPRKMDLQWFKNMGGLVGNGPRPHSGKINGGEKGWFWTMFLFGVVVGITGTLLDFPIWGQTRFTMQVSHVIHATAAMLFLAASFGHIYMGTVGAEGAFEGMWEGSVDEVWAQQHADLWYEEKKKESKI